MPNAANTKNKMGDRDLLADAMMTQAYMCVCYGRAADTATTPNLKDEFLRLLQDEENLILELFQEMQKRNWQTAEAADQTQILAVAQRHQNAVAAP